MQLQDQVKKVKAENHSLKTECSEAKRQLPELRESNLQVQTEKNRLQDSEIQLKMEVT